jgi:hypothetical protein
MQTDQNTPYIKDFPADSFEAGKKNGSVCFAFLIRTAA